MRALAAAFVVLAAVALQARQAGQPVFRSGVELVTIDVVATSGDGRPVHGLTEDDFELFEDGVRQPIRTFQFINLSAAPESAAPPPGVVTNTVEPGGLFAVVLDEIGVYVTDVRDVRRTAERFLHEALLPHDHVAVVRSGADSGFFLTADRTQAIDAVLSSGGRRDRGLRLEGGDALEMANDLDVRSPGATGRNSFNVLTAVVEKMKPIRARRKAVIWFSRGGDLPANWESAVELGLPLGRDEDALRRLIDAAREANVAIYTVDPRGLAAPDTSGREAPRPADIAELGTHRDLAAATGGRAIVNTNDLDGSLARVAVENRAYYLVGYEPAPAENVKRPRIRRLRVTTRAPGVSLLHRTVYVPGVESRAAEPDLLAAPLPIRDLPISLAPASVAIDRRKRGILLPFEVGGGLADGTEVGYTALALDAAGTVVARTNGRVKASGGRAAGEAGLAVDASTYSIRFAATISQPDSRGVVFATVRVPEGRSKVPECGGMVFEQPGARRGLRQFTRSEPLTISTLVSAERLTGAVTFGLAPLGGIPGKTWPVTLGAPLANGLWRVALSLKPPLPAGPLEIQLLHDGLLLNDNCLAQFTVQ